ncbi:MAG: aromatase/cyclase, partial [Angustibacter sp.]
MNTKPRLDRHSIDIDMSAAGVYSRLVQVSNWPDMFEPTIHACELSREDNLQTIQIWATAQGEPKTWVSERQLNPVARTIEFHQTACAPPVAQMSGRWQVHARSAERCTVDLEHEYRAEGDDPDSLEWIAGAVDANSTSELAALKVACERDLDDDAAPFTFSDQVEAEADPSLIFSFLERGDEWVNRLDHVAEVQFKEYPGDLQFLGMRTMTPDRGSHLTESFRIAQAPA